MDKRERGRPEKPAGHDGVEHQAHRGGHRHPCKRTDQPGKLVALHQPPGDEDGEGTDLAMGEAEGSCRPKDN